MAEECRPMLGTAWEKETAVWPHHLVRANQRDRLLRDQWLRAGGYPRLPHHVMAAWRLPQQLATRRLASALDELVHHHEALLSSFASTLSDEQVQIDGSLAVSPVIHHRMAGSASPEATSATYTQIALAPFQINEEALIRAAVVTDSEDSCILVLAVEHLVCDGFSFGILMNDLFAAYNGKPLPGVIPNYAAVMDARSHRELLDVSDPVDDSPVLPAFPWAHAAPPGRQSFAAGHISKKVDQVSKREVIHAARSAGVPVATLCLAALATCIHERTGGSDFRALLILLNRASDNIGLVGWFSNSVEIMIRPFSVRTELPELLESVQRVVQSCLARQSESVYERIRRLQPAEYGRIPATPMFGVNCQVPSSDDDTLPGGAHELPLEDAGWCVGVEANFHWLDDHLCFSASYNLSTIEPQLLSSLMADVADKLTWMVGRM